MKRGLKKEEREEIERSFETWRPFLDTMASQYSSWNRTVDREIAFLMYRGILTEDDVRTFVQRVGNAEQLPMLSRQEAITWTVRLIGRGAHAQAIVLPFHTPFSDDAQINPAFRRYVYYAKEAGIIQGADGGFNPTGLFTRAQMAVVFFNALNESEPDEPAPVTGGTPATIVGTIDSVHLDTHVTITSPAGTETFPVARNAVIMLDNTQRTAAFLRAGMSVTAVINAQRQIIALTARSEASAPPTIPTTPGLHSNEGFVTATTDDSVTIRTQRVNISGQVIDETRTFSLAPNVTITRGGYNVNFTNIEPGDIAFFTFTGDVIHELNLMERERTLQGTLLEMRAADHMGMPVLVIEEANGPTYELRVLPGTTFSRGHIQNLSWSDLRIGDAITADVELDRLVHVHGVGIRTNTEGRLVEIRITERNSLITIARADTITSFYVAPGVFDIYALRIGMQLAVMLDSREVISITVQSEANVPTAAINGFIQAIRADRTIVVVEGTGTNARSHTIQINDSTDIARGGTTLNFEGLRVNMNVHIVLTAPQSNVARSITVLP
jgi:hypothetical protein